MVGAFVVGAIVSYRNDFENSFRCVGDFSQARQIAFGEDIFGDELSLDSPVYGSQPYRLQRHPSARFQPAIAAFKEIAISPHPHRAARWARKMLKGSNRND